MAQSLFQVGGNAGQAIGPLLAAFIVVPYGQTSVAWFAVGSLLGIVVLYQVGNWYKRFQERMATSAKSVAPVMTLPR
jgi:FSR family fosmidomycin resistance protein-like MFS transporter